MAEPARDFDPRDDKNYWKPGVIDGDGEGDGVPSGDLKSVDLNEAEESVSKDKTDKKKSDEASDSKSTSHKTALPTTTGKPKGLVGKWKSATKIRRYGIGVAALSAIIIAVIGGILSLVPLKLQFIINNIESKVADIPQYAVERRIEYLTTDYMLRRMGARAALDQDTIYLGNSFVDTLYTNWRAVGYEKGIFNELGMDITSEGRIGRTGPSSSWRVSIDGTPLSPDGSADNLFNSREMRALIKDIAVEDTKPHQVLKRHNMRKILKRKYGVRNWRVFESTREKAAMSYLDKKKSLYITLVDNTVGKLSSRYSLYLNCLIEGGCDDIRQGADNGGDVDRTGSSDEDTNARNKGYAEGVDAKDGNSGITDNVVDGVSKIDADVPGGLARNLIRFIQKFTLTKFIGYFATGIGIFETLVQVNNAIDDGAVSAIIADKNALQYVNYATTFLTINDQMTSGEAIDSGDVQAAFDILDGFEESPVYQAEFGGLGNTNTVSAASSIKRDCDGDEVKETTLAPGETVCSNKKVITDVEEDIKSNSFYEAFNQIVTAYEKTVGVITGFIFDLTGDIFDFLFGDIIQSIMSATGLSDLLASGFSAFMNWIFGAVITGAETRGDAYDSIRAGVEINSYELMEDSKFGGGGAVLSTEEVVQLNQELDAEKQQELDSRPVYAKLFSTTEDSLLMRSAIALPSSVEDIASSIARLPATVFATVQNIFSFIVAPQVALAADNGFTSNPFSVLQTGYAYDNDPGYTPVDFSITRTGNSFEVSPSPESIPAVYDMDTPVDVLWDQYGCEVYMTGNAELIQKHQELFYGQIEGIPFDVPVRPNPCMLEMMVTQAGGALSGGELGTDSVYPSAPTFSTPPASGGSGGGANICEEDSSGRIIVDPREEPCLL